MEYMNMERFREIYAEWQESGQSVKTFTQALGMDDGKFYYWQKKLKSQTSVQVTKPGGFVQMPTTKPTPARAVNQTHQTPALCELVYPNGVMIRITSDLSMDDLRSLILLAK